MEEVKKWFNKAVEELDTAKYNIRGKRYDAGLFFLQQSAEKSLKALYIKKYKDLIRIHDLVILAKKVNAPVEIINHCKFLNPVYQYTRYPDSIPINNYKEKIDLFIKSTEEIILWSKKNL